jgi:hypothetical protein
VRKFLFFCWALLVACPLIAQASEHYCPEFLVKQGAPDPEFRAEVSVSPYTYHWHDSVDHKNVFLVAVHEHLPGGRLCGISLFSNSFGQPSTYVYAGQEFERLLGFERLSLKVTAGVLYGYVGQYQHKVPLNYRGFSPAIIPSVGYNFNKRDSFQIEVLGSAALMFSLARKF